jgi:hypothetical protein
MVQDLSRLKAARTFPFCNETSGKSPWTERLIASRRDFDFEFSDRVVADHALTKTSTALTNLALVRPKHAES